MMASQIRRIHNIHKPPLPSPSSLAPLTPPLSKSPGYAQPFSHSDHGTTPSADSSPPPPSRPPCSAQPSQPVVPIMSAQAISRSRLLIILSSFPHTSPSCLPPRKGVETKSPSWMGRSFLDLTLSDMLEIFIREQSCALDAWTNAEEGAVWELSVTDERITVVTVTSVR